jgi:hypothetical protein
MTYDTAWDMPQPNWQQQGSYEQGSIPPTIEPDAGTQVWLGPVAREWLPWICGSLDQLRNPSAWIVADDTAMYNTLRRVDTLLGLVCGNGGSANPVMLRFQDGVLQSSSDGGLTWTDVPGWTAGFCPAVIACTIPPIPPNPGPRPPNQQACDLAGYLATTIIHQIVDTAISEYNANHSLLDFGNTVMQDIGYAFPVTYLAWQAFRQIYNYFTAITISYFEDASADPFLWSELTCAIYTAIHTVGYIDDTNFASFITAVCAVTYTHHEVTDAICAFVTALGSANLHQMQATGGAYDIVDCSSCGGNSAYFDFRTGVHGFSLYPGSAGAWVNTVGWSGGSGFIPGIDEVDIISSGGLAWSLDGFSIWASASNTVSGVFPSQRYVQFLDGAGGILGTEVLPNGIYGAITRIDIAFPRVNGIDHVLVYWPQDHSLGAAPVVQACCFKDSNGGMGGTPCPP